MIEGNVRLLVFFAMAFGLVCGLVSAMANQQTVPASPPDQLHKPTNAITRCTADHQWAPLYADAEWYTSYEQNEVTIEGRLHSLDQNIGPATRGGLNFIVTDGAQSWRIYSPDLGDELVPAVGQHVHIRGKLYADLQNDTPQELWPGAFCQVSD